ncbi:hypothetical protein HID58_014430 [Brassica napus]|uniref:Retrotransposon gag domain-containing protein n=1 Tax=Brassica napus TaxID=3708 RepID=A0ABQ8DJ00_BRANA|nr:hypothetical protein HID58_014430 [Brassica napus]
MTIPTQVSMTITYETDPLLKKDCHTGPNRKSKGIKKIFLHLPYTPVGETKSDDKANLTEHKPHAKWFFYGGNCPETYLSWTANVETCIGHNHIPKNERLSLVASRLGGEARRWWEREEEKRWFHNRPAITTWEELQNIMDKRYIPKDFPEAVKEQYGRRPTRKKVPSSASQIKLSKAMSDSEGKANPPAVNINPLQVEAMVSEIMRRF